jgi:hypothetical protein
MHGPVSDEGRASVDAVATPRARTDATETAQVREVGTRRIFPCSLCGAPARIHVLEGYVESQRFIRRYCPQHADHARDPFALPAQHSSRLGMPLMLGLLGAMALFIGLFGDWIVLDVAVGFGQTQQIAVGLSVLVFVVGMMLRIDVIAFCGLLSLFFSLLMDQLAVRRNPGIGQDQQTVLLTGVTLIVIALVSFAWRTWRKRRVQQLQTNFIAPALPLGLKSATDHPATGEG